MSPEMSRHERLHAELIRCQEKGIIRSYYAGGGDRGTRWVVEGIGFTERVFTTAEAEAFALGATEGRTTGLLDGRVVHAPALVRSCLDKRL